jgi:hypothetical protein
MSYAVIEEEDSAFITLRRQYYEITNDYCAAKLIEYFKHWTNWKMTVHRTPWVYQPLERIRYDLIGEHSLHAIRRAIRLLEEMGLLERRHNPSNGQDKTWQYKLNLNRLNELLKHRKLRNEGTSYNGEQYHRSYINSDPYNNVTVEEEEMSEARGEELAKEVERWEKAIQQQEMEQISASEQLIIHEAELCEAALKDVEIETIVVNCDESDAGLEIGSHSKTAMAQRLPSAITSPNSAQEEEERIPRVIVTTLFPGAIAEGRRFAIAISSSPQVQKVQEQSGSDLGAVEQDGSAMAKRPPSAIAPANSTQELDPTPRVIVTSRIEGAIAEGRRCAISTSSTSQQQRIPEPQLSRNVSPPVPPPVIPQSVVPKQLSEEEIQKLEDELKRLSINPEPCMSIIQKYWNNVGGAIARVKEAIQAGWCRNATGLFIASCKKGIKPQKGQVSNEVNEWFTWARERRIVLAMSSGWVYTPEGEAVKLEEMMRQYPMRE